jgi:hypothetical protein
MSNNAVIVMTETVWIQIMSLQFDAKEGVA